MQKDLANQVPIILAHWHGDELALLHLIGHYKICTISSQSKDGEIMNTVIRLLGGKTVRGSSSRGAVQALKGLLRLLQNRKGNTSFALDGPKGPIYEIKPGVFEVSRFLNSQNLGGRIYPAGITASSCWRAQRAWNKAILPKPFSKVVLHWGAPLAPISRDRDPRDAVLRQDLSLAMKAAKLAAAENQYSSR